MVRGPASVAQGVTTDCGACHRGAVMLFSIATVVAASSRLRPALRREGGDTGASIHATEKELFTLKHIAAAADSEKAIGSRAAVPYWLALVRFIRPSGWVGGHVCRVQDQAAARTSRHTLS